MSEKIKERALMIFEAICMSYELPKGLTTQQEEDLLWSQFSKYGLDITRKQLIEWINEKTKEIYTAQLSDEEFAVFDLPQEGTWNIVATESKTMNDFTKGNPIKIKVNGFVMPKN